MKRRRMPGIRFRLLAGLILVFAASAGFLAIMLGQRLEARMSERIRADMMRIWQDTNLYAVQLLKAGSLNNDGEGFAAIGGSLGEMLGTEYEYAVCSMDGKVLGDSRIDALNEAPAEKDLEKLSAGKAVCRVDFGGNDSCVSAASLPVIADGKTIGILRVKCDYTAERRTQSELLLFVVRWILAVFAAALLVCFLLTGSFLRPVLQLSALSGRIAGLVAEQKMDALPSPDERLRNRRDEIGELAENYAGMISTIGQQFAAGKEDRKRILALAESKQRMFDHATHELKTPLTTYRVTRS